MARGRSVPSSHRTNAATSLVRPPPCSSMVQQHNRKRYSHVRVVTPTSANLSLKPGPQTKISPQRTSGITTGQSANLSISAIELHTTLDPKRTRSNVHGLSGTNSGHDRTELPRAYSISTSTAHTASFHDRIRRSMNLIPDTPISYMQQSDRILIALRRIAGSF